MTREPHAVTPAVGALVRPVGGRDPAVVVEAYAEIVKPCHAGLDFPLDEVRDLFVENFCRQWVPYVGAARVVLRGIGARGNDDLLTDPEPVDVVFETQSVSEKKR